MRTDALPRHAGDFVPWGASGNADVIGMIAPGPAQTLRAAGLMAPDDNGVLRLIQGLGCLQAGLKEVGDLLIAEGHAGRKRGEDMPVRAQWDGPILAHVDHAVMRCLGVLTDKVHLNGLLRGAAGEVVAVWVGRRADDVRTAPGHLDNLAAGGVSLGASIETTLAAEAHEEADIPAAWLEDVRPAGIITLDYATREGLSRERLHIFDLDVPPDFVPRCLDGEIAEFTAMDAGQLRAALDGGAPVKHAPHAVLSAGFARWFPDRD